MTANKKLKLYLVSQSVNLGYATYDAIIVVAYNSSAAKKINPEDLIYVKGDTKWGDYGWAENPSQCQARCIGTASLSMKNNTVVLASFNAG